MNRDGALKSIWQDIKSVPYAISPQHSYDVAIIGGGITGVTAAYCLQKAGKKCILLEAANIGFGTTGGTTAHLNTFFDAAFHDVIRDHGEENARLLAGCGTEAIGFIKKLVEEHGIGCSFENTTGYLWALDEAQKEILHKMVDASHKVGLPMDYIIDSPFPVPFVQIASIPNQAQFHPMRYITGVAKAFIKAGGFISEQSRVIKIEGHDLLTIETSTGNFLARNAIYATHVPPGLNILNFHNTAYRSYVIAVTLANGKYPKALGYDLSEPYHYYRSYTIDGNEYLIIGGEDHKTGTNEDTEKRFSRLEEYARRYFDIASVDFRWSSQYFVPADGLPYIGHLPGSPSNVYCATGFNGNGLIFGTMAGIILSDLITTGNNKYEKLFNPTRVKPVADLEKKVKESENDTYLIGDKFSAEKIDGLAGLAEGEAKVIKYDGHTLAAYKDDQNIIHVLNSACTHLHCNVEWNSAEQSWDCPCHGSRFDVDGGVLTGPAVRGLEKLSLNGKL